MFLEKDSEMEVAHSVAATAGETEVCFHCCLQFYVNKNVISSFINRVM